MSCSRRSRARASRAVSSACPNRMRSFVSWNTLSCFISSRISGMIDSNSFSGATARGARFWLRGPGLDRLSPRRPPGLARHRTSRIPAIFQISKNWRPLESARLTQQVVGRGGTDARIHGPACTTTPLNLVVMCLLQCEVFCFRSFLCRRSTLELGGVSGLVRRARLDSPAF